MELVHPIFGPLIVNKNDIGWTECSDYEELINSYWHKGKEVYLTSLSDNTFSDPDCKTFDKFASLS